MYFRKKCEEIELLSSIIRLFIVISNTDLKLHYTHMDKYYFLKK